MNRAARTVHVLRAAARAMRQAKNAKVPTGRLDYVRRHADRAHRIRATRRIGSSR